MRGLKEEEKHFCIQDKLSEYDEAKSLYNSNSLKKLRRCVKQSAIICKSSST